MNEHMPINARGKKGRKKPGTPITSQKLLDMGFMTDNEKAAGEYVARIVGGSDNGQKEDSDDDEPNDEIAELIFSPVQDSEKGAWMAFIETYQIPKLNTTDVISLGARNTIEEVVLLCKALKAWAITYPESTELQ